MTGQKQNLYFIAIVPPADVRESITVIKQDLANRFSSKKALRIIPHITLKAPFRFTGNNEEELLRWFALTPVGVHPFLQELKDFGSFPSKRNPVIFIEPRVNESLLSLQKTIQTHFVRTFGKEQVAQNEYHFSPHITVAYRDLMFHRFKEAWQEYRDKKFMAAFNVSSFHLLQHDGQQWNTLREFFLPEPV